MSSSIKILSYNTTSNELEHFFTYNWEVPLSINWLERISISELSQQFHVSVSCYSLQFENKLIM